MKLAKRETREGYQMNANSFGGERRSGGGSNNRHSRWVNVCMIVMYVKLGYHFKKEFFGTLIINNTYCFCSNHHDNNRKSYQNRFQSMSGSVGNGTAVGGNIVGAGVNDGNTNDRNSIEAGRTHDSRRGMDRDHRNREYHSKANDIEGGDCDNNPDNARKHKKHKRSRYKMLIRQKCSGKPGLFY